MTGQKQFWDECSEWLRKLREIWLRDVEGSPRFISRWAISFSGCLTFLLLVASFSLYSSRTAPFVEDITAGLLLVVYVLVVGSAYLAFLLAWQPSKAGPVRRFLAAVLLPAAVLFVLGTVLGQLGVLVADPVLINSNQ